MKRARKIILAILLSLTSLVLVALIAGAWISQTVWFKNKVRERIVAEAERTTGGRVEIGQFNYNWQSLTAEVAPFVLHGTEPANSPPLLRSQRIRIGLRIISFLEQKIDIASLTLDQPKIHIEVHPDGSTNLPTPKAVRNAGNLFADILNVKVRRFRITDGQLEYNLQRIPLDLSADRLLANLRYLPSPTRYDGDISSRQFHLTSPSIHDAAFDLTTHIVLSREQLKIQNASLTQDRSSAQISGNIVNFSAPRGTFEVTSHLFLAGLSKFVKLPVESRGDVVFNGKASVEFTPYRYTLEGRINGHGLAYSSEELQLRNFAIVSGLNAAPGVIKLPSVDLTAENGHFRGSAFIDAAKRFHVSGNIGGFSVQQLASLQRQPAGELSGTVAGSIEVEGQVAREHVEDLKAHGSLQLTPGTTGVPVEGAVELNYDQRAGVVQLGNWNMVLGTTHLAASGNLGQNLAIHLTSSNIHDLVLALPLIGEKPPKDFPIKLVNGGTAQFDGNVIGPIHMTKLSGKLQLTRFEVDKHQFSRLTADLDLTRSDLLVRSLVLDGDRLHATASGELGLVDWLPAQNSPIHAAIQQTSRPVISNIPITAAVTAKIAVDGAYGGPHATGHVQADNIVAYDQPIDKVTADVTYINRSLEVRNGQAFEGEGIADFTGTYTYASGDWKSGNLVLNLAASGFSIPQIQAIASRRPGINGQAELNAVSEAHFVKGELQLDQLDSRLTLRNVTVDGKSLGNLRATGKTRGQILDVSADADLREATVHGQGEWRLTGDYPGQGQITIPRLTFATLKNLIPAKTGPDLPFGGFLSSTVNITGPLKKPDDMHASVTIPEFQINASPNALPRAGAQAQDLVLRNSTPLEFDVTTKAAEIKSAHFTGTDTTIQTTGRVGFDEKEAWNLRINGSINLAILQLFNYDLLASGVSTLNTTIRGPLSRPELNGRLELKNASLFLSDFPNGVEKANGTIVFDRNRATVQNLNAESGGGTVAFQAGSFVGFSNQLLIYRLLATANHVRYRTPEGVSVTADASLSLAGTSERSTLAGTVTVIRAAFLPSTDVGSLLASTAKPVSVPTTPSAYVRGIQFDIRIDSAQNLDVVTSLTRNIQAEADLRLRGNIERPVVLGSISVTEGEIDFFGNKYTINHGEVSFFNTAKIEPVIDMDLETRVRGITVDIAFAGSLDKLNFSYRSDPPLESNQIIALLAVGRQPVGIGALADSQASTNASYLSGGGNDLLAQAVTAPVQGRLQRFFGVSHIKIDPELTDITSVPQARVSLEQQISKEITLTYVTNLSRTSEQVIRVEWDLSRRWSIVAVRDENGLFGVDFQYRRTFR